jgi:hypothetical protein
MTRSHVADGTEVRDGVVVPEQRTASPRVGAEAVPERPAPVSRWDRVRWGPVWAGALTVLATYLVLQLLFFALGWLDFAVTGSSAVVATVVSVVLALVAFFVGGLTTGAALTWRGRRSDGILNGILVWALAVTVLLGIGLIGAGSLVGPLGSIVSQTGGGAVSAAAVEVARTTAGWTALGLGLAALMAALGAGMGTKKAMWSPEEAASRR